MTIGYSNMKEHFAKEKNVLWNNECSRNAFNFIERPFPSRKSTWPTIFLSGT